MGAFVSLTNSFSDAAQIRVLQALAVSSFSYRTAAEPALGFVHCAESRHLANAAVEEEPSCGETSRLFGVSGNANLAWTCVLHQGSVLPSCVFRQSLLVTATGIPDSSGSLHVQI